VGPKDEGRAWQQETFNQISEVATNATVHARAPEAAARPEASRSRASCVTFSLTASAVMSPHNRRLEGGSGILEALVNSTALLPMMMCHSWWQWKNQAPGLWTRKRIMVQPHGP